MRVLNEFGIEIELESGDLFYKVDKETFLIYNEVLTNFLRQMISLYIMPQN